MSKNAVLTQKSSAFTTKSLVYCAMLAAIQIVIARFVSITPVPGVRFSLEAVPVVLSGLLFGPIAGMTVGFGADFIGCMFQPFGYNPLFCLPPILYGLFGGLMRHYVSEKTNFLRVFLAYLPAVILGSILWQSFTLAYVYNSKGAFWESLMVKLSARCVQFGIAWPVEALITTLLLKSGIFQGLKLWPLAKKQKSEA